MIGEATKTAMLSIMIIRLTNNSNLKMKLFLTPYLILLFFFCSCNNNANINQLQSEVLNDIKAKIENQGEDIEVKSFVLTHLSGNEYVGILETIENGQVFRYNVNVVTEGSSFVWEIPSSDFLQKGVKENSIQDTTYTGDNYDESNTNQKDVSEDVLENTSFMDKLSANIYVNNENGFETFLSFKEGYNDQSGVMTLSQLNCRYVYNIKITGDEIKAKFFQSTCGSKSSNTSIFYDNEENSLSMNINGQRFTFYPQF